MDTTLRDGEQTSGVSFAAHEKLSIAQALLDLGVNRLEIASARVSDGEFEAVKRVAYGRNVPETSRSSKCSALWMVMFR